MLKNIYSALMVLASTLLLANPAFAEGEAHHSGGLPQFNPASWPSQIFWLTIFFVVLYFAFSKSILPTLGSTIETREGYISENLKKAEALSIEAQALRTEIDKSMKSALGEAKKSVTEAEGKAKVTLAEALAEFRSHYESEVEKAESRIAQATTSALSEMDMIAATLAAQAAEKIAGIPASESGAESVVKSLSQKTKLAA